MKLTIKCINDKRIIILKELNKRFHRIVGKILRFNESREEEETFIVVVIVSRF